MTKKTLLTEKETYTLLAIFSPPVLLGTLVANKVSVPNAIAIVILVLRQNLEQQAFCSTDR